MRHVLVTAPCSVLPPKGRQKSLDHLHIGRAVPVENIVVPSLVEDVEHFRFWRHGIEHFGVAHRDQLVVPGVQHQRPALKAAGSRRLNAYGIPARVGPRIMGR